MMRKQIILLIMMALFLVPVVRSETKVSKVIINDIYSVELLKNTENCFNCEAVYEVCNLYPVGVTISDLNFKLYDTKAISYDYFKVGVLDSITNPDLNLKDIKLQYETEGIGYVQEPVFEQCQKNYSYISNKTAEKVTVFYNDTCFKEYKETTNTIKVWADFKIWDMTNIDANKCIKLRLTGNLGWGDSTDHVFYIDGVEVKEFAWWNNSYLYKKVINITNNDGTDELLVGYTANFTVDTTDISKFQEDCDDLRIVYNGSGTNVELDRTITNCNISTTLVEFAVQSNISTTSTNTNTYWMYYGCVGCANPPENRTNVFLYSCQYDVDMCDLLKGSDVQNMFVVNTTPEWIDFHTDRDVDGVYYINVTQKTGYKLDEYELIFAYQIDSCGANGAFFWIVGNKIDDFSGYITIADGLANRNFWDVTDTTEILGTATTNPWEVTSLNTQDVIGSYHYLRWNDLDGNTNLWAFNDSALSQQYGFTHPATKAESEIPFDLLLLTNYNAGTGSDDCKGKIDNVTLKRAVSTNPTFTLGAEESSNAVPVIDSARISPTMPHINDTLLGFCNATDANGDNVSYEWIWYSDGGEITACSSVPCGGNTTTAYVESVEANVNNISFTLAQIGFPRNITLACRANDSGGYSSWLNSTKTQLLNDPPTVSVAAIQPSNPNGSSDLTCTITATDPESLASRIEWWWYNGSVEMGLGGNFSPASSGVGYGVGTLGSGNTSRGETWNCTAQAYDNYNGTSSGYDSAKVNINNTPPYLTITMNTTDSYLNRTAANLTCLYNCSDVDGDTCDAYSAYKWHNDTGVIAGQTTLTLISNHTSKGDNITCEVTIEDDSGYTGNQTIQNSSIMFILNTPPNITSVSLTSPLYLHLTATCTPSAIDVDGDSITYYYKWFNDTGQIANQTASTLNNTHFWVGVNITCNAIANDGDDNSSPLNSSTVQVLESTGLNITIKDEQTNIVLSGITIYLEATSGSHSTNTSTTTGSSYITNATIDEYEIRYWASGYDLRFYYINVTSSNQTLTIYLLNSTESDLVLFEMTDTAGKPVDGAYLKVLRRYIVGSVSSWDIIEMAKSDVNGEGVLHLELYDVPYRFMIERDGVLLKNIADEAVISRTTLYFKNIDILGSGISGFWLAQNAIVNLSWNNATNHFDFTWSSLLSQIIAARLEVSRHTSLQETMVCNASTSGTSGTLSCNLTSYIGQSGSFVATGYVDTNSSGSWYSAARESWEFITEARAMWGISGAFYSFLIIIVLAFMAHKSLWNPNVTIFLAVVGLGISWAIGSLPLSLTWLMGIIIVGVIVMMQNKA